MAVRVAHLIRAALEELDLPSYVKTSGADGIHVLLPIARRSGYDETYEFAELLSRGLEAEHPGEVTTEWLKKKRSGVLVDHRQNGHGKTIASVYSVRPKPGAPVSTPLAWEELTEEIRPRDFPMAVALDRVSRLGDLFEPVLRGGPGARTGPPRATQPQLSPRAGRSSAPAAGRRGTRPPRPAGRSRPPRSRQQPLRAEPSRPHRV